MEPLEFETDSSKPPKESKLRMGEEYRDGEKEWESKERKQESESEAPAAEKHSVDSIYSYKEDKQVWICPNCETENESGTGSCCVCGCADKRR